MPMPPTDTASRPDSVHKPNGPRRHTGPLPYYRPNNSLVLTWNRGDPTTKSKSDGSIEIACVWNGITKRNKSKIHNL